LRHGCDRLPHEGLGRVVAPEIHVDRRNSIEDRNELGGTVGDELAGPPIER
jgi:hypothetical protein